MQEKLDNYLVEKYPKIFINRYKGPMESCLYFGFEHNDGWFWLLDQLCESIQGYIDNNNKYSSEDKQISSPHGSMPPLVEEEGEEEEEDQGDSDEDAEYLNPADVADKIVFEKEHDEPAESEEKPENAENGEDHAEGGGNRDHVAGRLQHEIP